MGEPALRGYVPYYRRGSSGGWSPHEVRISTTTRSGLTNGQSYQVRVAAINDEGEGPAVSGSATPNP